MSPSDLGTIFGTLGALGALLLGSMQLAGARMTLHVASAAFLFSLVVGVWATIVGPMTMEMGTVWKFGMLYGILFLALLLERAARKEEAEEKLAAVPDQLAAAKVEGTEIGQRATWRDRYQFLKLSRQYSAKNNAVSALVRLCDNSEAAMAIVTAMNTQVEQAEQDALNDIATQIEQLGILSAMPRNPE